MYKYRRAALIAIVSIIAAPAVQAKGGFFIGGQSGQIELSDTDFSDDSTDIQTLSLGYRWQAGSIAQVGIEVGGGKLGKLSEESTENYFDSYYFERTTLKTTYAYLGANARFQFGAESRWFAITRLGYMGYDEKLNYNYEIYDAYYDSFYSDSGSDNDSGSGAYFGAGIGVDLSSNFNINLIHSGYAYSPSFGDDYDDGDLYTASSTTLGLEVRF